MQIDTTNLNRFLRSIVKVELSDTHYFIGQLLAYDKHLNIVLNDTEEHIFSEGFDTISNQGLIIIRGDNVKSVTLQKLAPIQITEQPKTNIEFGVGHVQSFGRGFAPE